MMDGLLSEQYWRKVRNFYIVLAREADRQSVPKMIAVHLMPDQRALVGVIDPPAGRGATLQ